ncbi:hypothetical protein H671_20804 [Cricetulus griseus]|nr:hypothetical protein H671_20804 [Cricetulus griseus]
MLQAPVEFQFKAVNTQQTVTIIDAIHVIGVLHAITNKITIIVSVGKRTRDRKAFLKAKPNTKPSYLSWVPTLSALACDGLLTLWNWKPKISPIF